MIIPIIGGGLAEGVLPLSIAYSEMLHRPQAELVAQMVPAALLGNVVAIVALACLPVSPRSVATSTVRACW